jgi:hypothetical protein
MSPARPDCWRKSAPSGSVSGELAGRAQQFVADVQRNIVAQRILGLPHR